MDYNDDHLLYSEISISSLIVGIIKKYKCQSLEAALLSEMSIETVRDFSILNDIYRRMS